MQKRVENSNPYEYKTPKTIRLPLFSTAKVQLIFQIKKFLSKKMAFEYKIIVTPITEPGEKHQKVTAFERQVIVDGKEVYSDSINPKQYFHGKDPISQFMCLADNKAGYRHSVCHPTCYALKQSWITLKQWFQLLSENLLLQTKILIQKFQIFVFLTKILQRK